MTINFAWQNRNQSTDMGQFGYLYVVDEHHVDMMHMYEAVREIVRVNQPGPQLYLQPIYAYYSAVLSDRIKLMTESIFEQNILPGLPVCFSLVYRHLILYWKNRNFSCNRAQSSCFIMSFNENSFESLCFSDFLPIYGENECRYR